MYTAAPIYGYRLRKAKATALPLERGTHKHGPPKGSHLPQIVTSPAAASLLVAAPTAREASGALGPARPSTPQAFKPSGGLPTGTYLRQTAGWPCLPRRGRRQRGVPRSRRAGRGARAWTLAPGRRAPPRALPTSATLTRPSEPRSRHARKSGARGRRCRDRPRSARAIGRANHTARGQRPPRAQTGRALRASRPAPIRTPPPRVRKASAGRVPHATRACHRCQAARRAPRRARTARERRRRRPRAARASPRTETRTASRMPASSSRA
mmetsp:Transcript_18876/g.48254  ORF Transcript_18876/g.48254 Transcript_18876/m.48254 type:complete len:268 (-) Transcript_18876:1071-1874(-)